MIQRADGLSSIAGAALCKMVRAPVVNELLEGDAVPCAFCPLRSCCLYSLRGRVSAFRHIAHYRGGSFPRFGQRDGRTGAERDAPFVTVQGVLAKVRSPPAGCYTDR